MPDEELEKLVENLNGGNLLLVHTLAATVYQINLKSDLPWTTDNTLAFMYATLEDLYKNQGVSREHYVHAKILLDLLTDAVHSLPES